MIVYTCKYLQYDFYKGISDEEMFIEEKELRVNVKEWMEFKHKIIGESALQIKWLLWAKICSPNNRDHVSETTWVQFRVAKSVMRNKMEV